MKWLVVLALFWASVARAQSPTPTCSAFVPVVVTEYTAAAPETNATVTIPAGGIDACHSVILSYAWRNTLCSAGGTCAPFTVPHDSAGNIYHCAGVTAGNVNTPIGFGCPEDGTNFEQLGTITCTANNITALPGGSTITIPLHSDTGTDVVSVVDAGFKSVSAKQPGFAVSSTTLTPYCLCEPNGVIGTVGGVNCCSRAGAGTRCSNAPHTCSGPTSDTFCLGYFFGNTDQGVPSTIPANAVIWSALGSLGTFTSFGGTQLESIGSSPKLTTLYTTQAITGPFTQGGNGSNQVWSASQFYVLEGCQDPALCGATPTVTPTATDTPTATETPTATATSPPATATRIAQETATAGPPATQTQAFHETQTAAPTSTPTHLPMTPTGTPPTPVPNGCCGGDQCQFCGVGPQSACPTPCTWTAGTVCVQVP